MRAFADSFYFLALLNAHDAAHQAALRRFARRDLEIVTTRWVLAEVFDALSKPDWRTRAIKFMDSLASQPDVTILKNSDALFDSGFDLYRNRPDKAWSLTDCISFVTMEREGLREALTGDRHFDQAGFTALLAD